MSEEHRRQTIRTKLARMESRPALPPLPTGFPSLDSAIGGGIPRPGIIELYGPSSSGKTTIAFSMVAHLQHQDGAAAWIDADHTFDPAYATSVGVTLDRMPLARPETAEQALEIAAQLAATGALELIVIDSAAALIPEIELEAGLGESGPGLQSRVLASGLKRLGRVVARGGCSMLFLNQSRRRMSPPGVEAETSAGGAALKLHAAVRIALSEPDGRRVEFHIVKNKAGGAFTRGIIELQAGPGAVETP